MLLFLLGLGAHSPPWLLLALPEPLKKEGAGICVELAMGKDAFGQREVAGRETGSLGWWCPGREEEGSQGDEGGLPTPSVHTCVADPSAEPAPLVVVASLGVTRGMAMLG